MKRRGLSLHFHMPPSSGLDQLLCMPHLPRDLLCANLSPVVVNLLEGYSRIFSQQPEVV